MIFLSRMLHNNLSCYNNGKNIEIKPYKNNEVEVTLRGHCGTHIDFPLHYIADGKTLKDYTADDFVFNNICVVPYPSDLAKAPKDTDFIIFQTGRPRDPLDNIGLDEKTAEKLVKNFPNLRAIGIDSISINAHKNKEAGRQAHKILLGAGILIVEDLDLSGLNTPVKQLIVAPLQIAGADGAPVTVIAKTGYEAIFFDWDGVITDSVNIKTDAYIDMFKNYGAEVQEKVKAHHQANGGMSRFEKLKLYYQEFLGIEIDDAKVQEFSQEFSGLVLKKAAAAEFITGAVETIKKEHAKGTKLFVVTGTPTDEIIEIAKLKGLGCYFTKFCGSPVKKDIHVKNLLEKYGLKPQNCLFIGDAIADYNAAAKNGVSFLGIKIPSCKTDFPAGTEIKTEVEL